jgi:hypothetical protein
LKGIGRSFTPDELKIQAENYDVFNKMCYDTGAQGIIPWWWPGGFRCAEDSDFGLVNPDLTPRPVAAIMKKYVDMFKQPVTRKPADHIIMIDRDLTSMGFYGVYTKGCEEYYKLMKEGKTCIIKTDGTGTDSTNVPLTAVGNVPYTGSNPMKYLNSEYNYVRYSQDEKSWTEIKLGDKIVVDKTKPVYLTVSAGNINETEWIAPAGADNKGKVFLSSVDKESGVQFKQPIRSNVKYLEDAVIPAFMLTETVTKETVVVMQLTASGRAWFGPKFKFIILNK